MMLIGKCNDKCSCSIITLLNGLTREFDDVVHAMKCPTGEQAMTTNTMASTMQHRGR